MLQQTQVATVVPYYKEWMRHFPSFAALAAASEADVLHAWQGLGYYARARNLRAAAIAVTEKHGCTFPRDLESIRALPGIGRYTANAIATFAFDWSVPIVEANIARVLSRVFDIQASIDTSAGREQLWSAASQLVPRRSASEYNSALMELGALVCSVRPKCPSCPVKTFCRTTDPTVLPRKKRAGHCNSSRNITVSLFAVDACFSNNPRSAGGGCGSCLDYRARPRNISHFIFRNSLSPITVSLSRFIQASSASEQGAPTIGSLSGNSPPFLCRLPTAGR